MRHQAETENVKISEKKSPCSPSFGYNAPRDTSEILYRMPTHIKNYISLRTSRKILFLISKPKLKMSNFSTVRFTHNGLIIWSIWHIVLIYILYKLIVSSSLISNMKHTFSYKNMCLYARGYYSIPIQYNTFKYEMLTSNTLIWCVQIGLEFIWTIPITVFCLI